MEVTVKKVEITLPEVDMALLKELAKKFGWNIGRKKSGIEKGLEDIKAGRVYKANGRSKKELLWEVIGILQETGSLPMQYHPHKLSGKFEGL